MRSLFLAILAVSFIGLAVFGFSFMTGGEMFNHQLPGGGDCVMTVTQAIICPKEDVASAAILFVLLLAFSYFATWIISDNFFATNKITLLARLRPKETSKDSRFKDWRWLAFHINSPGKIPGARA